MILITGATGRLGSLVIGHLLENDVKADEIAALVRNTSDTSKLKEWKIDCRVADYNDRDSLSEALKGIDFLVFISGNDVSHRMQQHQNVVDIACDTGVKHVIYIGSIHGRGYLLPVARAHIETEELIKESGMDYTILRDNLYMENIAGYMGKDFMEKGIYFPAGEGKVSFVSRNDIATVITNVVLNADTHKGQVYEISNAESYSFYDIARVVSHLTGKEIRYLNPSPLEYMQKMAGKLSETAMRAVLLFGQAIAADEFLSQKTDIKKLLGHKPVELYEYLRGLLNVSPE